MSSGEPTWAERWQKLSPRARSAVLHEIKAPVNKDSTRPPLISVQRLAADLVEELTASGLVERRSGLTARQQEGTEGEGFHFRIKITPAGSVVLPRTDTEVAQGTPPLQATLMNISVAVSWNSDGATRQVELDTRRLTSSPAQQ